LREFQCTLACFALRRVEKDRGGEMWDAQAVLLREHPFNVITHIAGVGEGASLPTPKRPAVVISKITRRWHLEGVGFRVEPDVNPFRLETSSRLLSRLFVAVSNTGRRKRRHHSADY
jgi:hypothetical protein